MCGRQTVSSAHHAREAAHLHDDEQALGCQMAALASGLPFHLREYRASVYMCA